MSRFGWMRLHGLYAIRGKWMMRLNAMSTRKKNLARKKPYHTHQSRNFSTYTLSSLFIANILHAAATSLNDMVFLVAICFALSANRRCPVALFDGGRSYDYYYLRHDDITKKLDRIREREEHYGLGPIFDELKPPDKYPVLNGADLDFFCLINGNNTYQIVEQVDVPFKIDKTSADALVRKEHPTKIVTCIDVNVDAIGCYEEAFNEDSVPDFPETYDGLGVITHLSVAAKAAKSATTANTGMTKSVSAYNEAMAVMKEITSFVENDEDKQKMMKRLLDVRDACMADKQANMANAMAKKNGGSSEKDLDTYVSSNFARDKRHNAKRLRTAGNI